MKGGGKMTSQDYKFFQCDNELEEWKKTHKGNYDLIRAKG